MRFRLASIIAITLLIWPHAAGGTAPSPASSQNLENPENLQNPQNLENLQNPEATPPAHVAYVEGSATLERDGRPEHAPVNMPLLSGDRLKTMEGRVEVLFADGSALHMDARTTIDLQSDDLVRLIDGRLRLSIAGGTDRARTAGIVYRVDSPAGSIRVTQPGEYRVAMLRRREEVQLELAVLRGSGEIFTDEGTTTVRAGERAYASAGLAPSYAYTYNSANWDAFDRWSESRRDTRLGVSTQYLPSEVRAYASTFDEDGDWRYNQSYGYVWYPRVAVGWRPYYYGRWARYPRFGWTWIGADRFAWATHHYGRWGFATGAWFWIPANRWAPAYVSWAYAPGYVSWCPLGFDNRPVLAINIFNVRPGYYSSARAWTVVGYSHFGRDYVHRRAVDWDRFDRGRRPSFQVAHGAPASRDIAVPRSSPIHWAGSRSLPADRLRQGGASAGVQREQREAGSRTTRTSTALPPSGARSGAGGRSATAGSDAPRYINRGDDIIRSPTGRPSAPQPRMSDFNTAVPRTAPSGPARRAESFETPAARADADRSRPTREAPPAFGPGAAAAERRSPAEPRAAYEPRSPYEQRRVMPRADAPAYQPPVNPYQGQERRAIPRGAGPDVVVPNRESAAPSAPDAGPRPSAGAQGAPSSVEGRGYARPRPSTGAQGAPSNAERRGGFESRPAPAGGGERQAPAPRAMPAPERSAPSGDRAVPRDPGAGRSAPPAGAPSGARSRGRGGV